MVDRGLALSIKAKEDHDDEKEAVKSLKDTEQESSCLDDW
jgi:hypothetical protein